MIKFKFAGILFFFMDLVIKKCMPCEAGTVPFDNKKVNEFLEQVPSWQLKSGHLYKKFKFKDFIEAMKFINSAAKIAEEESHHPDFYVHYNKVEMEIWTHAINGLSENDFILAAKIDSIKY